MKYLPFFPDYPVQVTARLESCRDGDTVVYFFKGMPVFSHHMHDVITFHMITAQFCVQGHAEQDDIVRAYRVPAQGVELAVELYRDMGADGFTLGPRAAWWAPLRRRARQRAASLERTRRSNPDSQFPVVQGRLNAARSRARSRCTAFH